MFKFKNISTSSAPKDVGRRHAGHGGDPPHHRQGSDEIDRAGDHDFQARGGGGQKPGHGSLIHLLRDEPVAHCDGVHHGEDDGHQRVERVGHEAHQGAVPREDVPQGRAAHRRLQIVHGGGGEHIGHDGEEQAENRRERQQEFEVRSHDLLEIGRTKHLYPSRTIP